MLRIIGFCAMFLGFFFAMSFLIVTLVSTQVDDIRLIIGFSMMLGLVYTAVHMWIMEHKMHIVCKMRKLCGLGRFS